MKLTQTQAKIAALIQEVREAPGIPTFWLPLSYVMAHVQIESEFDAAVKAGDFAATGSVGLMQVEMATAAQVAGQYPLAKIALPQTDPLTSLTTGMLYLRDCYDYLLPVFGAPLLYRHVCVAYNEGPGNAADGLADFAYYYKWYSAQQLYAYLDTEPSVTA